jgi:hypothetical protein
MGLALGGVGTFFFTRDQVIEKDRQLQFAQMALQKSEDHKVALRRLTDEFSQYLSRDAQRLLGDELVSEEIMRSLLDRAQEELRRRQSPTPSPSPSSTARSIEPEKKASPSPSLSASPSHGDKPPN